jgi:hypothetical protein
MTKLFKRVAKARAAKALMALQAVSLLFERKYKIILIQKFLQIIIVFTLHLNS